MLIFIGPPDYAATASDTVFGFGRPPLSRPRAFRMSRMRSREGSNWAKHDVRLFELCISKSFREARSRLAMSQAENFLLVGDRLLRTLGLS
jgi:hypothetical protein